MLFRSGKKSGGAASTQPSGTDEEELESHVGEAELPIVLDKLTVLPTNVPINGRININTAPATVLALLPEVDANLAQQIVESRSSVDPLVRRTPAWLFTQGLVNAEVFKRIAPLLTARSYQFRVRCVGFGWPHGKFRTLEAVVDVSGPPRIIYLRDITRAGPPVPFDVEGSSVASGS